MGNKYLMRADEIAEELGVSKPYAYKLMQKLNKELAEKGFLVINGSAASILRNRFMECLPAKK